EMASVSSTVLAHDIYSTLRDRDGHLCCGGQDWQSLPSTLSFRSQCQLRLQCCRMVVTIYQGLMKLFPPTWQHHRLMIAFTAVPIIQWQMSLIPGVDQYMKTNLRRDASLLQ